MMRHLWKIWRFMKIRRKIALFTDVMLLIILLSIALAAWAIKYSVLDFSGILENNSITSNCRHCLEEESAYFERYIKNGEEADYDRLQAAIRETKAAIEKLPDDYEKIGESRYARTWSIQNAYQVYCEKRDQVLYRKEETPEYILRLYEVYDMQDYLKNYAGALTTDTLEEGVELYRSKTLRILIVPSLIIFIEILLAACILKLADLMKKALVDPVTELAEASRKIAENEFFIEDVQVQSDDEMGELVHAFNKMRYATGEYILALEEKRNALDLYHAEEMEKLEMERRLNVTELELLKNQINPHFLFNTLNVIGGMADLEGAQTTEQMIQALSSLFRYNLKTPEEKVPLARELKVIKDYMFLQEMRFGGRITCKLDCRVNAQQVYVPTFTFQPLVENAIIHGLSPKEEGGCIFIRIRERGGVIRIAVADNGVGMDRERLWSIRRGIYREDKSASIGLNNIYKRVTALYEGSFMAVHSRSGGGTIIRIDIPDERGESHGEKQIPHSGSGRRADRADGGM